MGLNPDDLRRLGIAAPEVRLPPELAAAFGEVRGAEERAIDPLRSAAAARARADGEAFELDLKAQHDVYRAAGLADVEKVDPPVTVLGPTKRDARGRTCFSACWAQRTSADFAGVLAGGRAVRLEAKLRAEVLTARDVAPHQVESLRRCHDLGGLALLLVRIGAQAWAVPAEVLWRPGVKTWRPARLDEIGARLMGLDWLKAMGGGR